MQITVGIVDDHQLFVRSLSLMLEAFTKFVVTVEASNGKDLEQKLRGMAEVPSIMLIDVNMPIMGGIQTVRFLKENYPSIKMVALSMNDTEKDIVSMIREGCCSYLLKDTHPATLEKALLEVHHKGYFHADAMNLHLHKILSAEREQLQVSLNEKAFLQLACSDLTYKEIAIRMSKSERTIDGYREALFGKFNVQSRVGLCLEAIRKNIVPLEKRSNT